MIRKLSALALIGALALVSVAGKCDNAKHNAALTINTVEAALALADDTERLLECGTATAIEGHCLNPAQARAVKEKLRIGFRSIGEARDLYVALPEGTPTAGNITALVLKAADIVREILAGFPDSKAKAEFASTPQVKAIVSAQEGK